MSEDRNLLGLLNGIARHDYYKEDEITDEFLKNELYPDMGEAEFEALVQKARGLTKVKQPFMYIISTVPEVISIFITVKVTKDHILRNCMQIFNCTDYIQR